MQFCTSFKCYLPVTRLTQHWNMFFPNQFPSYWKKLPVGLISLAQVIINYCNQDILLSSSVSDRIQSCPDRLTVLGRWEKNVLFRIKRYLISILPIYQSSNYLPLLLKMTTDWFHLSNSLFVINLKDSTLSIYAFENKFSTWP